MELYELSIKSAKKMLDTKQISSLELTNAFLNRIQAHDNKINSFITIDKDDVIAQAKKADKDIANKNISGLTGIPIAIKDILCTKGIKTTCASKILKNFVPDYDASAVALLKKQGAVILGKTNLDEFAMGGSTENSAFETTKNPWNNKYVPGGSSGGSAAAVSAQFCTAALGTDTGGSIRQPASHCGVVGVKPSYGRVSRYGMVAFGSSLDQIGPLTKDVEDAAFLLNIISGNDEKDSTSAKLDVPDFTRGIEQFEKNSLKTMTAGIPKEYLYDKEIDVDVQKVFENAKKALKSANIKIKEISLPHTDYAVAVYYILASCEASSNLARYDGVKYGLRKQASDLIEMYQKTRNEGFGSEVKRRILIGTYALCSGYYEAYYKRAAKVQALMVNDFEAAFKECDFILTPIAPSAAFKIGEKIDNPLQMYLSDMLTVQANLAKIPGISIPAGYSSHNLPIGIQIMTKRFDETTLFRAGYGLEKILDIKKKFPEL